MKITNNTIYRKSSAYLLQIPRSLIRRFVNPMEYKLKPPVLANSFPKSGTHLLLQILNGLPKQQYYGSFIASMPSLPFRERTRKKHLQLIDKIIPGELLPGHLFFDPEYQLALAENKIIHYFIYRDTRDVVISEVYYLSNQNRWHRLHKYFKEIDSLEEKINFCIQGFRYPNPPYDYPNIADRFSRYKGWLNNENVCAIKYEDLLPGNRRNSLKGITEYYLSKVDIDVDIDEIVRNLEASINPQESHTFRQGGSGGWKNEFSEQNKQLFKEIAGDLLIELGYETGYDW